MHSARFSPAIPGGCSCGAEPSLQWGHAGPHRVTALGHGCTDLLEMTMASKHGGSTEKPACRRFAVIEYSRPESPTRPLRVRRGYRPTASARSDLHGTCPQHLNGAAHQKIRLLPAYTTDRWDFSLLTSFTIRPL
jgi:hypothetical protein